MSGLCSHTMSEDVESTPLFDSVVLRAGPGVHILSGHIIHWCITLEQTDHLLCAVSKWRIMLDGEVN